MAPIKDEPKNTEETEGCRTAKLMVCVVCHGLGYFPLLYGGAHQCGHCLGTGWIPVALHPLAVTKRHFVPSNRGWVGRRWEAPWHHYPSTEERVKKLRALGLKFPDVMPLPLSRTAVEAEMAVAGNSQLPPLMVVPTYTVPSTRSASEADEPELKRQRRMTLDFAGGAEASTSLSRSSSAYTPTTEEIEAVRQRFPHLTMVELEQKARATKRNRVKHQKRRARQNALLAQPTTSSGSAANLPWSDKHIVMNIATPTVICAKKLSGMINVDVPEPGNVNIAANASPVIISNMADSVAEVTSGCSDSAAYHRDKSGQNQVESNKPPDFVAKDPILGVPLMNMNILSQVSPKVISMDPVAVYYWRVEMAIWANFHHQWVTSVSDEHRLPIFHLMWERLHKLLVRNGEDSSCDSRRARVNQLFLGLNRLSPNKSLDWIERLLPFVSDDLNMHPASTSSGLPPRRNGSLFFWLQYSLFRPAKKALAKNPLFIRFPPTSVGNLVMPIAADREEKHQTGIGTVISAYNFHGTSVERDAFGRAKRDATPSNSNAEINARVQ